MTDWILQLVGLIWDGLVLLQSLLYLIISPFEKRKLKRLIGKSAVVDKILGNSDVLIKIDGIIYNGRDDTPESCRPLNVGDRVKVAWISIKSKLIYVVREGQDGAANPKS